MARELIEIGFRAVHGDDTFEKLKNEPGLAIQSVYSENSEPSAGAGVVPAVMRESE